MVAIGHWVIILTTNPTRAVLMICKIVPRYKSHCQEVGPAIPAPSSSIYFSYQDK